MSAFDPNHRAIELLKESLRRNHLEDRAQTHAVAVSSGAHQLKFQSAGSFTGHVTASGGTYPALPLTELIRDYLKGPSIVKIDVEGYEAELCPELARLPTLHGSVLVIELHPAGFNGLGDPRRVVQTLTQRGDLQLRLLDDDIERFDPSQFRHLEAKFPHA